MINRQNLRSDLEKALAKLPALANADIKGLVHDIEHILEWHAPEIFPGPNTGHETDFAESLKFDPFDKSAH